MNKFFTALGVFFAILLLLVAAGVGSIWAYQRYLAFTGAVVTAPQTRQEMPAGNAAQSEKTPAPIDDSLKCAVWDRARVMAESAAGKKRRRPHRLVLPRFV